MKKAQPKIAKRYAKALLESYDGNELDAVRENLDLWAEAWHNSPDLRATIANPGIPVSKRQDLLKAVCDRMRPGDTKFLNFLLILLDNGRLVALPQVAEAFSSMVDQLKNILSFEVTSAFTLPQSECQQIKQRLESVVSAKLRGLTSVDWKVDNSVIGGLKVRVGDSLLDGSVSGTLARLKTQLTA